MTDTVLYREFVLSNFNIWAAVVAFVKANARAAIESGSPLLLIVTAREKQRNFAQNNKLHKVLREIAESAWWGGRQYPMEFWKEYYRRRFLLKDEHATPDGEIVHVYWSTADLSVKRFSEFIEQVQSEATNDFGVEWNF